jgi:hypothetical protein
VPWLKISTDLPWATAIYDGFTIFIVGGLIKAAAAGALTPTAWRLVRRSERGGRPTLIGHDRGALVGAGVVVVLSPRSLP